MLLEHWFPWPVAESSILTQVYKGLLGWRAPIEGADYK